MKILIGDQEVSYSRVGTGRIILLLHGWGTSKEDLKTLSESLSSDFDVISIDFPGFGESQAPQDAWGVREYAGFIRKFLEQINVREVYGMIGHSFGGRVIIKGISSGVLRSHKVVLVGAAGVKPKVTVQKRAQSVTAKIGKAILSLPVLNRYSASARQKLYDRVGAGDYLQTDGIMRQVFLKTINEDLSDAAKDVTCDVLLVWGSEDDQTPIRDARYYASVMPKATLKIVQEAGHFVHNDNPRKVARWVKSFLG